MFDREGMTRGFTEAQTYALMRDTLHAGLSAAELAHYLAEGAALTEDQAVTIESEMTSPKS